MLTLNSLSPPPSLSYSPLSLSLMLPLSPSHSRFMSMYYVHVILLYFLYNILFVVHVYPCLSVCIEHVCVFSFLLRSSLCLNPTACPCTCICMCLYIDVVVLTILFKYTYRSWYLSLYIFFLQSPFMYCMCKCKCTMSRCLDTFISLSLYIYLSISISLSACTMYMYTHTHTHTHTQSNVFRFCSAVTCSFWSSDPLACSSLGCWKSSSSSLYYFMFV